MHAEAFLDTCGEVREVFDGRVGRWVCEVVGAEFGDEEGEGAGCFEKVVEYGFYYYREGVGAA
jgi:hypothetical protein